MEEYHEDGERTNVADGKEIGPIERARQRATIGILLPDNMPGHHPPDKQTGEEGASGQHVLGSELIAEIKNVEPQKTQTGTGTHGQGTDDGNDTAHHGEHPGGTLARGMQLLVEEGSAYLVHRDSGGQRGKDQQGVEHDGDDIADDGHGREGLMEHIGQGDEDERRSGIGGDADGEGRWENHQARENGNESVEQRNLDG